MKIQIIEDPELQEAEVVIRCPKGDVHSVQDLLAALRTTDRKLCGRWNGETVCLNIDEVLYIDTVDRKVFLYTDGEVYETERKLFDLEKDLCGTSFFRASKAVILNLSRVRSMRPELGARLLVTMENGEKIIVSRQYSGNIKKALEVK